MAVRVEVGEVVVAPHPTFCYVAQVGRSKVCNGCYGRQGREQTVASRTPGEKPLRAPSEMVAAEMRPQDMDPNFQGEANGAYNFPVSGEATTWGEGECPGTEYEDAPWKGDGKAQALSQYNPTPGSGRVGYINIPPEERRSSRPPAGGGKP